MICHMVAKSAYEIGVAKIGIQTMNNYANPGTDEGDTVKGYRQNQVFTCNT